jgi:hypothetical protein
MKHVKLYATTGAALLAGGVLVAGPLSIASGSTTSPAKTVTSARPLSAVIGPAVVVGPGGHGLASATCPAGKIVSGGGGQTSAFDIEFTDSYPSGNGWVIRGTNHGSTNQSLWANAVCLGLS